MKLSDEDRIRMLADLNREGNETFHREKRAQFEKRQEKLFIEELSRKLGFKRK